ncbi:hypothetical protein AAMO2058_000334400 [Amorphochlora amoebiformis]
MKAADTKDKKIDLVLAQEAIPIERIKNANSLAEFLEIVKSERSTCVERGKRFTCYALISKNAQSESKYLRLNPNITPTSFEVTVQVMGKIQSQGSRSTRIDRPPFTTQLISAKNGEIIVIISVDLDPVYRDEIRLALGLRERDNISKYNIYIYICVCVYTLTLTQIPAKNGEIIVIISVYLDPVYRDEIRLLISLVPSQPKILVKTNNILDKAKDLRKQLNLICNQRPFIAERGIQQTLSLSVIETVIVQTNLITHQLGVYVVVNISNAQGDVLLHDITLSCTRTEKNAQETQLTKEGVDVSLTPLRRFFKLENLVKTRYLDSQDVRYLDSQDVGYLDSKDVRYLDSQDVRYLDSQDVRYLDSQDVRYLDSQDVRYLDSQDVRYLDSQDVRYLDSQDVRYLDSQDVRYLNSQDVRYLDSQDVRYLDSQDVRYLDSQDVRYLNSQDVRYLDSQDVRYLDSQDVRYLDSQDVRYLDSQDVRYLNSQDVRYLDSQDVRYLDSQDVRYLDSQDVRYLNSQDVRYLDSQDVRYLDSQDVRYLDSQDVRYIDSQDVRYLDSQDVRYLDSQDVRYLDCQDVRYLDSQDVRYLDSQDVRYLDSQDVRYLDSQDIQSMVYIIRPIASSSAAKAKEPIGVDIYATVLWTRGPEEHKTPLETRAHVGKLNL